MKKLSKYFIVFLFVSLFATYGCVKDNGNYDYKELPKMDIPAVTITDNGSPVAMMENNTVYVSKNGNVVIDPHYEMDKTINPKYTWTLIVGKQPNYPTPPIPGDVISTSAKLEYKFTQAPGSYKLILEVLNDSDLNFKKIVVFNLVIESVNGVAVLYTKNGKGDLMVFKTHEIDANVSANDVLEKANVFSKANNGVMIENNPTMLNIDYHLTKKINFAVNGGVLCCDVEFKTISTDYESLFAAGKAPSVFAPQFLVSRISGTFAFMVNNNKLWARSAPQMGYGDNMFGQFNDNDYYPFIAMDKSGVGHIIFNQTYKRFEYLLNGYGFFAFGMDQTRPPKQIVPGGVVAINDTKMDIVAFNFSTNYLTAIMRDGAATFAVRFNKPVSVSSVIDGTCLTKMDISSATGLSASSVWEIGSRGDYAFYSSGNEIYILNTLKGTAAKGNLNLPSDETITKITLYRDDTNTTNNGGVIFVSTLKNGEEGTVYQYKINPLSGRPDIASMKSVKGLGKVVDINIIKLF